jgi:hypothetical protein
VKSSSTEGALVPPLLLQVITLELKDLQIIAKMTHKDDQLHMIRQKNEKCLPLRSLWH